MPPPIDNLKTRSNTSSLGLWQRHGENLLVLQPFMDSVIVKGDRCHMVDADGNRILDLAAGQFCSILGYSHPRFVQELQRQLAELLHLGDQYISPGILKAASRLAGIAPGQLTKVVFLSTGSEANECAMRMAKTVTSRTGMLGFTRGYYGISLATRNLSSISDHPGKTDFRPAPVHQDKLITPTCQRCPIQQRYPSCSAACLDVSFELLSSHLENIAGVIVEPILSAGGMIFPPKDYLQKLRAAASEFGFLFIVDEAQTGFGRCGEWFDIQNYEIEPDIMVISKTGGNGYPAAAVIVSDSVAQRLERTHFTHLSSHQNDPVAAAAVHAVINIVEEERLVDHSRAMGQYFMSALHRLQQAHKLIKDVRGRGLMIGLELEAEEGDSSTLAFKMAMLCESKGLHVTFSYFEPVIRIIPPLIISSNEIDAAVTTMDEALGVLENRTHKLNDLFPQNSRSGPFTKGMLAGSPLSFRRMWHTSPQQWVNKLRSLRRTR
jgi:2,2-dialkylglycine decarboxylase (pyruvate)